MNIQLFIIMALVASSLLTLTDRASAKELNKQRYLQSTIEQLCCEEVAPDQDKELKDGSINSKLIPFPLLLNASTLSSPYKAPLQRLLINTLHPRAPPVFLT